MSCMRDYIELAMHISRVASQVSTALKDQVELPRVLHLAIKSLSERITFHQVSVSANGNRDIVIIVTES